MWITNQMEAQNPRVSAERELDFDGIELRISCIRKCRPWYSCKCISNLKGVVDGSKRRRTKLKTSQSPLSIRSSELLNSITHRVRFSNTTCELKITRGNDRREGRSAGPRMFHDRHNPNLICRNSSGSSFTRSQQGSSSGSRIAVCEKCGESLKRREDDEAHHLSKHVVVTHVLAATGEIGACSRSQKVPMAILKGKWVLSIDWVKACIEMKGRVDEEPYEISPDTNDCLDGPRTGRQADGHQ